MLYGRQQLTERLNHHMRFVTKRIPISQTVTIANKAGICGSLCSLLSEFRLGASLRPLPGAQLFLLLEAAFTPQRSEAGTFSTQQIDTLR